MYLVPHKVCSQPRLHVEIQIMGLGLAGPFPPKIPLLLFSKQENAVLHG